ncbi:MAG: RNA 3'-terminal phosphate cyclase [Candidatus Aenigmatarchaeota archaeon]
MIEIDGSYGEAGGQILRTAIGLSVITQTPVKIFNIRAKRAQPGLKSQHLEGLRAAAQLCNAKIEGDVLGSTEIKFYPDKIERTRIEINIPTAGSIGLVLQVLQLACVYAPGPVEIVINGGADFGKFAPPIPWLQAVLLPLLKKMGYEIEINSIRSGFYPKGGAITKIDITPVSKLSPIFLIEQGKFSFVKGISVAAQQLKQRMVAERQAVAASKFIEKEAGLKSKIDCAYVEAANPGSGIVLWAETDSGAVLGSSEVGQIGITAEQVGQSAAKSLIDDAKTGACIDRHAADQILPFLALANGKSIITVPQLTSHAKTNMWVIKKFLNVDFSIFGEKPVRIECTGSSM